LETRELLDLVDENDTVIATLDRSEVFAQKLKNFRAVCALIKNKEGKLFIPRRALDKIDFAGAFCCIGGCVSSGETYEQAFRRETLKEVGIDIATTQYRLLGILSPYIHQTNGYIAAYEITIDQQMPIYSDHDFSGNIWITPTELLSLIERGEQATINLKKILELFYRK